MFFLSTYHWAYIRGGLIIEGAYTRDFTVYRTGLILGIITHLISLFEILENAAFLLVEITNLCRNFGHTRSSCSRIARENKTFSL